MELSIENIINKVQNEPVLWDGTRNASEEEKDVAWKRIVDIQTVRSYIRVLLRGLYGELAIAVHIRIGLRFRLFEGILYPLYIASFLRYVLQISHKA